MITNLLITTTYPVIKWFINLFNDFNPNTFFDVSGTVSFINQAFSNLNQVLPMTVLSAILILDVIIVGGYIAFIVISWVIKKIPFIN